jgi:DNA repair protein RadA/Sms
MRVYSDRIDPLRVSRIAAVLEKQTRLDFSSQEIYVNVAGGLRLTEPAVDLPLACALYSARTGQALPLGSAIAGELSLAGEVRPVRSMDRRAKAASQLGFERIIGPGVLLPGEGLSKGTLSDQAARAVQHASQSFRWACASSLKDTLRLLWNQENRT